MLANKYLHASLRNIYIQIGNREALVDKINCITTNPASLKLGSNVEWPIRMNDHGDTPWLTEIEKVR